MTTAIFKLAKYVSCARDLGLPESERLDLLQEGNPYQQRCRGLAPRPQSTSFRTSATAHVPTNPASSQGS